MPKQNRDSWSDADVQCPFFLSGDRYRRSLTCEGCADDCNNVLNFRSLAARDSYMGRYCVSRYKDCPVSRAANAKYEDRAL